MSADVKAILELRKKERKVKGKKDNKEEKKKPDGINREVFSLTNGVPPLVGIQDAASLIKSKKRALNRKVDKWLWTKFDNPARKDGLKLSHWQKSKNIDEPYPFAKLNHQIKLVKFDDDEYETHLKDLNKNWTKEETLYLWDMCELFNLKFIVIHDRYDKKYQRTVEELKDRYYTCAKKLCEIRNDLEHPVVRKPYNYDYEVKRKYYLERLYMRSKQQHEREKHIIDYIKKLDQKIKKLEKEEKSLDKILNEDKSGNLLRKQEEIDPKKPEKKENFAGAYLRSQRMLAPIPVSEKVQQQMDIILKELEINPNEIVSTEQTVELYDEMRKEILKMLSLHRHIKKRKDEIANLDEKLKDLEDFSKIVSPAGGAPVRQMHPSRPSMPPQINPNNMNPSLSRQSSQAIPDDKPVAPTQPAGRVKSPSKESKAPSQGSKVSGKKRKAPTSQAGSTKRARNS